MNNIQKLLIANRSIIAARIQATAHQMDIQTVCIYAQDDIHQEHLASADFLFSLSGNGQEAYLAQDEIIAIALQAGADAIHPGYGLLSEVAAFAQKVIDAGLQFIGPDAKTISLLGDKGSARAHAQKCGIPTIPGATFFTQEATAADAYAITIGYPVILKISTGGGGRGMTTVDTPTHFATAWQQLAATAQTIVVEKYLHQPRHIEIQIAGDGKNVIHFFERECSIQRRHQKVIEEAPAEHLSAAIRQQLYTAAINLCKSVAYTSLGTVEFVVLTDETFYFLEVNPRIQVEHGVTECITGIDLVALQLHLAQHKQLPYSQKDISYHGHAIQCRVYAEHPDTKGRPSTGTIYSSHSPQLPFTRINQTFLFPYKVSGFYDAMLSKLITWGKSRCHAQMRMTALLRAYRLSGIPTNLPLLAHIIAHEIFSNRQFHTQSMHLFITSYSHTTVPMLPELTALATAQIHTPPTNRLLPLTKNSLWGKKQWK